MFLFQLRILAGTITNSGMYYVPETESGLYAATGVVAVVSHSPLLGITFDWSHCENITTVTGWLVVKSWPAGYIC